MSISLSRLLAVTVLKAAAPVKPAPVKPAPVKPAPVKSPKVSTEEARVRDEKLFDDTLTSEQVFRGSGPVTIKEANDSLYPNQKTADESLRKAEEYRAQMAAEEKRTGKAFPWIWRQDLNLLKGSRPLRTYLSAEAAKFGGLMGIPAGPDNDAAIFLGQTPNQFIEKYGRPWWIESRGHEIVHATDPYLMPGAVAPTQPRQARTSKLAGALNKTFHEASMPEGRRYDNRDAMKEMEPVAKELKLRLYHMGIDPYSDEALEVTKNMLLIDEMGGSLRPLKGDVEGSEQAARELLRIARGVASTDRQMQRASTYA